MGLVATPLDSAAFKQWFLKNKIDSDLTFSDAQFSYLKNGAHRLYLEVLFLPPRVNKRSGKHRA